MNHRDSQDTLVLEGARKCIDNAKSIFMDATLLREGGRHIRAFTLFHMAAEEAAKGLSLLTGYLFGEFDTSMHVSEYFKSRKAGKSHLKKMRGALSTLFPLAVWSHEPGQDIGPLLEYISEECDKAPEYTKDKERSLYVEYDGSEFTVPDDSITVDRCDQMRMFASVAIQFADGFHQVMLLKAADLRAMCRELDKDKMREKIAAKINAMLSDPSVSWHEEAKGAGS